MFGRGDVSQPHDPEMHPYDGVVSAGTRFFVELLAWFIAPVLIAERTSLWVGILAFVALAGVTAVFSTPGDKRKVIVPTPGPLRVLLELALYAIALWAVWNVAPQAAAIGATIVVAVAFVTGLRRWLWLLRGAPL